MTWLDEVEREWLDKNDVEIASGCMEEWRYSRQVIVEEDEPGFQRRYAFPAQWTLDHLARSDPQRALNVAFLIARAAENDDDFVALGVGLLTQVTTDDPTLWGAIEAETKSNPKLLRAVGQVSETNVPQGLLDAYFRSTGR